MAQFTSTSEFDLDKRIQLTNEVPPYDIYDALNSTMKNDLWKWVLGSSRVMFNQPYGTVANYRRTADDNFEYTYKRDVDAADYDNMVYHKFVNGEEAENYGPVDSLSKTVGQQPKTFTKYHTMEVNGVVLPEFDFLLHEVYRYLDTLYPDHYNYDQLLTPIEMNDMFMSVGTMLNYKIDNAFFEEVADTLNCNNDLETLHEATMLKIRNLRNNTYRRQIYGSRAGYRMFANDIFENVSVYPIGTYLPIKEVPYSQRQEENLVYNNASDNLDSPTDQIDSLKEWNESMGLAYNKEEYKKYIRANKRVIDTYSDIYYKKFKLIDWRGDESSYPEEIDTSIKFYGYTIPLYPYTIFEYPVQNEVYSNIYNTKLGYPIYYGDSGYDFISKKSSQKYRTIKNTQKITNGNIIGISSKYDSDSYLDVQTINLYKKAEYNMVTLYCLPKYSDDTKQFYPDIDGSLYNKTLFVRLCGTYKNTIQAILNPNVKDTLLLSVKDSLTFYPTSPLTNSYSELTPKYKFNYNYIKYFSSPASNVGGTAVKIGSYLLTDMIKNISAEIPNAHMVLDYTRGSLSINVNQRVKTSEYNRFFKFLVSTVGVYDNEHVTESFRLNYDDDRFGVMLLNEDGSKSFVAGSLSIDSVLLGIYTEVKSITLNIAWIPNNIVGITNDLTSTSNRASFYDEKTGASKVNINSIIDSFYIYNNVSWSKIEIFDNLQLSDISLGYLTVAPAYSNAGDMLLKYPETDSIHWAKRSNDNGKYHHTPLSGTCNTWHYPTATFTAMTDAFRNYCALGYTANSYNYESYSPRDIHSIKIESIINIDKEGYENVISFESDSARELFKTLSVGDIITGPSIDSDDEDLIIIGLGDNTVTVNRNLQQSGTFLLNYAIKMDIVGKDISKERQQYKKDLRKFNIYKPLNPFNNGIHGSATWPYTAKAYVDGLADTSFFKPYNYSNSFAIVMKACHDLINKDVYEPSKEDPDTMVVASYGDRLIPSTIKYLNDLFVEYNITKVLNVPTKDKTSTETLMSVDWLDYLDNNLLDLSRATDNVNVGAHLIMNTDTSGEYAHTGNSQYTDPSVKVKFFTLNWPKKSIDNDDWYVPRYAQVGNTTTHTFTTLAKEYKPSVKKAQLYGIADYDRIGKDEYVKDIDGNTTYDVFGNRVINDHSTIYTNAPLLSDSLKTEVINYYNIEKPIFEVPLGEYDTQVKYFMPGSNLCTTVQVSIYKQTFNNLLKYLSLESEDDFSFNRISENYESNAIDNRIIKINPTENGISSIFVDSVGLSSESYLNNKREFGPYLLSNRPSPFLLGTNYKPIGQWVPDYYTDDTGVRQLSYPASSNNNTTYNYYLIWNSAEITKIGTDKKTISIKNNSILIEESTETNINRHIKGFQAVNTIDYSNTTLLNWCDTLINPTTNELQKCYSNVSTYTFLDTLLQKYLVSTGLYNKESNFMISRSALLYPASIGSVYYQNYIEGESDKEPVIFSDILNKYELKTILDYDDTISESRPTLSTRPLVQMSVAIASKEYIIDNNYYDNLNISGISNIRDYINSNKLLDIDSTADQILSIVCPLIFKRPYSDYVDYRCNLIYKGVTGISIDSANDDFTDIDWLCSLKPYLVYNSDSIVELNLYKIIRDLKLYALSCKEASFSEDATTVRDEAKKATEQLESKPYMSNILPTLSVNIDKYINCLENDTLYYINMVYGKDDKDETGNSLAEPITCELTDIDGKTITDSNGNPKIGWNSKYTIMQDYLNRGDIVTLTKIGNGYKIALLETTQKFVGSIPVTRLSVSGVSNLEFNEFTNGDYSTYRIIDKIVSSFKLPRRYLTDGSYNFDFILDPRFVGEGYEYNTDGTINKYTETGLEDTSKLVKFNISKSAIYYDNANDAFYTYSNKFIPESTEVGRSVSIPAHFSSENKKYEIKFNEQKYFKNVLYSAGIYQSKQYLDVVANAVKYNAEFTSAPNLDFNLHYISPSDKILSVKEILLRSEPSSAVETSMFAKNITMDKLSIIGISSDKLAVGTYGDNIDKIRLSNKIKNIFPKNSTQLIEALPSNDSEVTRDDITYNTIKTSVMTDTLFDDFKFFKNTLLLKGTFDYSKPSQVSLPTADADRSCYQQALNKLKIGDTVINGKVDSPINTVPDDYVRILTGSNYKSAVLYNDDIYVFMVNTDIKVFNKDSGRVLKTISAENASVASRCNKLFINDDNELSLSTGILDYKVVIAGNSYSCTEQLFNIAETGSTTGTTTIDDYTVFNKDLSLFKVGENDCTNPKPFISNIPTYSIYHGPTNKFGFGVEGILVKDRKLFVKSQNYTVNSNNYTDSLTYKSYWKYGIIPDYKLITLNVDDFDSLADVSAKLNEYLENETADNVVKAAFNITTGTTLSYFEDTINSLSESSGWYTYTTTLNGTFKNKGNEVSIPVSITGASQLAVYVKLANIIINDILNRKAYTSILPSNSIITGMNVVSNAIIFTIREKISTNLYSWHIVKFDASGDHLCKQDEIQNPDNWTELSVPDLRIGDNIQVYHDLRQTLETGALTYTPESGTTVTADKATYYYTNKFFSLETYQYDDNLYFYGETYSPRENSIAFGGEKTDSARAPYIIKYNGGSIESLDFVSNTNGNTAPVTDIVVYNGNTYAYINAALYKENSNVFESYSLTSDENIVAILKGKSKDGDIFTEVGSSSIYYISKAKIGAVYANDAKVIGIEYGIIKFDKPLVDLASKHLTNIYLSFETLLDIVDQSIYISSDDNEVSELTKVIECESYKKANRVYSVNQTAGEGAIIPTAYPKYVDKSTLYKDTDWLNANNNKIYFCDDNGEYLSSDFSNTISSLDFSDDAMSSIKEPLFKTMEALAESSLVQAPTEIIHSTSNINTLSISTGTPYIIFNGEYDNFTDYLFEATEENLPEINLFLSNLYDKDINITNLSNLPESIVGLVEIKKYNDTDYLYNKVTDTFFLNGNFVLNFTAFLNYGFNSLTSSKLKFSELENNNITDVYIPAKGYGGHRNNKSLWEYKQPWDIDSDLFKNAASIDNIKKVNNRYVYLCDKDGNRLESHKGFFEIENNNADSKTFTISLDDCDSSTKDIKVFGKYNTEKRESSMSISLNVLKKSPLVVYVPLDKYYLGTGSFTTSLIMYRDFKRVVPKNVTFNIVDKTCELCTYTEVCNKVTTEFGPENSKYKLPRLFSYNKDTQNFKGEQDNTQYTTITYNKEILEKDTEGNDVFTTINNPYYLEIIVEEEDGTITKKYINIEIVYTDTGDDQSILVRNNTLAQYFKYDDNENYILNNLDFDNRDSSNPDQFGTLITDDTKNIFIFKSQNQSIVCTDPSILSSTSTDYPIVYINGGFRVNTSFYYRSLREDNYKTKLKYKIGTSLTAINPPINFIGNVIIVANAEYQKETDPNVRLGNYIEIFMGSTKINLEGVGDARKNHFIANEVKNGTYQLAYSSADTTSSVRSYIMRVNGDGSTTAECSSKRLETGNTDDSESLLTVLGKFSFAKLSENDYTLDSTDIINDYKLSSNYIAWNSPVEVTINKRNKNIISGVPGPIILVTPKYDNLNSAILGTNTLSGLGYKINSMSSSLSWEVTENTVPFIKAINDSKLEISELLDIEGINDSEEHYIELKLLTSKSIPFNNYTHNEESSYVELPISMISEYTPDRVYFNPNGYIKSPIKIGKNVYRSENFEAFNNEFYFNNNKMPIYECNQNGKIICYYETEYDDSGYTSRTLSLGEPISNGFIPLEPLYTSCKDWFKNKFWVEGSEQNPFWQIVNITSIYNNSVKHWQQVATLKKYVRSSGVITQIDVKPEEAYVSIDSPCTYDVNNDVTTVNQKDVYVNVKNGKISFILYQPSNTMYYDNEFINSYGINAYSSFYGGNSNAAVNLENNSLYLAHGERVSIPCYVKSTYTVNSLENMANPLDKDAGIAAITELGLFNKDHVMIAYAYFPPIEYRTDTQHVSFTCVINNGNFNGSE